jgi:exodeoxyribonuclease VII large subunit
LQQALSFPSGGRRVFTVSDLASGVRTVVEKEFDDIWVEGELSGFKRHRSGHCYFTIKDDQAQIRGVLWRHFTRYIFFEPRDGMLVRLHGQISLYEARGDVQFVARSMQMAGEGALQAAFEKLKHRLAAEGLFDATRKRDLPRLPERIGVITSGGGAAVHDILSILGRRFPSVEVVVCPVAVQGIDAAGQISQAIRRMNAESVVTGSIDVLIVGRGGGSIEDLWAFNEEIVARAIAASSIPVISAVGHETDYTIADFAADFRAATPSMAAEIVTPDVHELRTGLREALRRVSSCIDASIRERRMQITHLLRSRALHRPVDMMRQRAQRVDELAHRMHRLSSRCVENRRRQVDHLVERLTLLDPERPLAKGYARIERNGSVVTDPDALATEDIIEIVFRKGSRRARIVD